MKRLSAILAAVLLLIFSTVFSAAAGYSVVEAEFDIPDEFIAYYGEEDLTETEAYSFINESNGIELSCYCLENTDEISFSFMNLTDSVDYFFDNISAIDGDDYTFESVQTWHTGGFSQGIMFEGTVNKSGKSVPVEVYAFSTTGYLYGFEFLIYDETERYLISDVVDSLYIDDFELNTDVEDYDDDDGIFSLLTFLVFSVVGVVSTIIKLKSSSGSGSKQVKTETRETPRKTQETIQVTPQKESFKKFELNGKNINIFNERFTVGKADDNFAQSEIERERKEREKMFK